MAASAAAKSREQAEGSLEDRNRPGPSSRARAAAVEEEVGSEENWSGRNPT